MTLKIEEVKNLIKMLSSKDSSNHGKRSSAKTSVARDRTIYGPLLCLLPPQKIAILLAHTALSSTVADGDIGTKVISLAMHIAQTLETEINVSRALRVRASKQKAKMLNRTIDDANNEEQLTNINIPHTDGDATRKTGLLGEM